MTATKGIELGDEFCASLEDLRLLCRVAQGSLSPTEARLELQRRRWSRRDAVDFVAIAAATGRPERRRR